jgi:hypothetical protein
MKLFLEGFKELDHADLIRVNGGGNVASAYAGSGSAGSNGSASNTSGGVVTNVSPSGYTQIGSSDTEVSMAQAADNARWEAAALASGINPSNGTETNISPSPYKQIGSLNTSDADIADALNNNLNQAYLEGKNDCDKWLEKCFDEAGMDLAFTAWGSADSNTVSTHIQNIGGLSQRLGEGINIFVCSNEQHCGAIRKNSDGSVTIWHCGYNSSTGKEESATKNYPSLAAFTSSWSIDGFYDPIQ